MDENLLFDSDPIRVKRCKRGIMIYFANDSYIGRSLDCYGEFSEGEAALFQQIVQPGMTVLDAGGNVGAHTICFAKEVGPGGKVIAVEPQRAIFHMLCGNLALNKHSNVVALHSALGATSGTTRVPRIDYTKGSNFG